MATISLGGGPILQPGQVQQKYTAACYIKPTWGGLWFRLNELVPLQASNVAFPGRSRATLQLDVGRIKRPDSDNYIFRAFRHDSTILWADTFVAIVVFPEDGDPYPVWCGYIPEQDVDLEGSKIVNGNPEWSTSIIINAYGLDHLLEMRHPRGAWFDSDGTPAQILRRPTFNERARGGANLIGNRNGERLKDPDSISDPEAEEVSYVFGNSSSGSGYNAWSVRDIIEYALHYSQRDISQSDSPHFKLSGDVFMVSESGFLGGIKPIVSQERENVRSLINKLIDRRRGVGMRVRWGVEEQDGVNLPSGVVDLEVFSMAPDTITVGDKTLPFNVNQVDLDFENAIGVNASVKLDSLATYDEIIVEGERVQSVFTVGGTEYSGNDFKRLERAWTDAQEEAYLQAEDEDRRLDKHVNVFRLFKLPDDFDWVQGDVSDGNLAPSIDDNGIVDFNGSSQQWNSYVKILNTIPLQRRDDLVGEATEVRYLEPFALVERPYESDRYLFVDGEIDEESGDYRPASVTPGDRAGTVEVKFTPNHVLGFGVFDPSGDPSYVESDQEAIFDWRRMLVTLAVELDLHASVRVVTNAPGADHGRRLTIKVPDAHLWVAGPSVVDGLDDGGVLHYYTGSRIIRDDTDRLRSIAALAKTWYGTRRRTIEVTEEGLFVPIPVGYMVRTALIEGAQKAVDTVVSEQTWDFEEQKTAIRTGYAELDLSSF